AVVEEKVESQRACLSAHRVWERGILRNLAQDQRVPLGVAAQPLAESLHDRCACTRVDQDSKVVRIGASVADKPQYATNGPDLGFLGIQIKRRDSDRTTIDAPDQQPKRPGPCVGLPPAEQPFPAIERRGARACVVENSPFLL